MNLFDRSRTIYQCNLYERLKAAGIKQVEMANLLKLGPKHINRLCKGYIVPYEHNAIRIANILNTTPQDIWPDFDAIMTDRREQNLAAIDAGHKAQKAKREAAKKPHMRGIYKMDKSHKIAVHAYRSREARIDEQVGPIMPVTLDDREPDFVLRARHMPKHLIEDDSWCRKMADHLHRWILSNSVWGVYRHLRAIMYAEHRMALEREAAAAAAEVMR